MVVLCCIATGAATAGPTAGSKKLSAAEKKWVTPALEIWNTENAGLQALGPELKSKTVLTHGSKSYDALLSTLSAFAACPKAVASAGKPPSTRLLAFYTSLTSACAALDTGATTFAKGIGNLLSGKTTTGQAQIKTGYADFTLATKRLAAARKQVLDLRVPGLSI